MARKSKFTDKVARHTPEDEANLLLEISEDNRLRRIGIDPDGDPVEITLELKRKMDEIRQQKGKRKLKEGEK